MLFYHLYFTEIIPKCQQPDIGSGFTYVSNPQRVRVVLRVPSDRYSRTHTCNCQGLSTQSPLYCRLLRDIMRRWSDRESSTAERLLTHQKLLPVSAPPVELICGCVGKKTFLDKKSLSCGLLYSKRLFHDSLMMLIKHIRAFISNIYKALSYYFQLVTQ